VYYKFEMPICFNFRLMPESVLTAPKEKKLGGRQWFESGRAVPSFPNYSYSYLGVLN